MEDIEAQKIPEAEHPLQMEPSNKVLNQHTQTSDVELNVPSNTQNSPGVIILQWLTYASLSNKSSQDTDQYGITRTGHGWIKNHALYRR